MVARDVMNQEPTCVATGDTLRRVVELMVGERRSALPVVDEEGTAVGIISAADVLAWVLPRALEMVADWSFVPQSLGFPPPGSEKLEEATVGEVLGDRPCDCVAEDEPLVEVARLLMEECRSCCPVTRDGKLVGVIERHDLLRLILSAGSAP